MMLGCKLPLAPYFPSSLWSSGDLLDPKEMTIGSTDSIAQDRLATEQPKPFSLKYCKEITNDFSKERKLHEGPFGDIYKGICEDGQMLAVKIVREIGPEQGQKPFENDYNNVRALYQHKNIVRVVGYCREIQERGMHAERRYTIEETVGTIICYEYLSNGNLHDHLIGKYTRIDWRTRFNMIKGICRGLQFLQGRRIIHLDLKPENIWLDKKFVPKIANFGLSILFRADQIRICTDNLVGPYGYMAPEYFYNGEISAQSDIYSLAIVIIEITTGEKNLRDSEQPSARQYINKIRKDWTEEHIASKYSSLDAECLQQVNMCIKIGLACAEINPQNRPSIDDIVDKLETIRPSRIVGKGRISQARNASGLTSLQYGVKLYNKQ